MADLQNLSLGTEGSILTITINRESKLNALNSGTIAELKEVFQSVYDDKDINGVIITGQIAGFGQLLVGDIENPLGFHGVAIDRIFVFFRRVGVEMAKAAADERAGADLKKHPA